MDYKKEYEERLTIIRKNIREWLPDENVIKGRLPESMNYSITSGGKFVRPMLMYEACRLFNGNVHEIKPFFTAIECLHIASLVHDDLPAIDNDDLRRGQAATHAKYGEAMGLLCGDALINYAYETLIYGVGKAGNTKAAVKAARYIAVNAGYEGTIGGQSLDVVNEKNNITDLTIEDLDYINERKTSSLIKAALYGGAAFAGASEEYLKLMEQIGSLIGRAFQIMDDVLDVTASTEALGKPAFSDEKNGKTTYVTLLGEKEASLRAQQLTNEAVGMLERIPANTEFLKEFLTKLVLRDK